MYFYSLMHTIAFAYTVAPNATHKVITSLVSPTAIYNILYYTMRGGLFMFGFY